MKINCLTIECLAILLVYFNIIIRVNSACTDHPQCNISTIETIRYYDYPGEEHHALTGDGYILGLQRIPFGKEYKSDNRERPAVLILHGLLSSSIYYVVNGPAYALGFLLADAGFDVWLGNDRGNTYSRKNIYYSPDDPRFWEFSCDNIFLTDVPTMIDYVISHTSKSKISLIGYSMGTTSALGCLSGRPEYNEKIKKVILLAPTLFTNGVPSPAPLLLKLYDELFFETFAPTQAVFPTPESYVIAKKNDFCEIVPTVLICPVVNLGLRESKYINQSWDPVYYSTYPAGSSSYVIDDISRIKRAGKFIRYEYKTYRKKGILHYPTNYDLKAINVPITLFYSKADEFVSLSEVHYIQKQLGSNIVANYVINDFKHADFVYSHRAKKIVYDHIIPILKDEI